MKNALTKNALTQNAINVSAALTFTVAVGLPNLALANDCAPTEQDGLGNSYIKNTAIVNNLNRFGKPGEEAVLAGKVLSAVPPYEPIADAEIELWQKDGAGNYHPRGFGDAEKLPDEAMDMRGTVVSNEHGLYAVGTVVPGDFGYAGHVHYRVTAPGYQEVATQLYVEYAVPCREIEVKREGGKTIMSAPPIYLEPDLQS